MGLLNFLKPQRYDMDSLEGINSIPVPAKNYHTGDPTKDCIYYLLQRKATEHKKAGRMDCAIACLRKSNALSDYEKRPLLVAFLISSYLPPSASSFSNGVVICTPFTGTFSFSVEIRYTLR